MEIFSIGFVEVTLIDIVDILIVAFIIYKVHKIFLRSIFIQALYLLFFAFIIWRIVELFNLILLKTLLDKFLQIATIGLLVVFSPDIRRILITQRFEFLSRLQKKFSERMKSEIQAHTQELVEAVFELAETKTGAIIVVQCQDDLDEIIKTGDILDSRLSKRVLQTIFYKSGPLHDGAVIIKDDKIIAARCVLPVSDDPDLPAELGLRHRSALGITEVTDAIAIVVSEQTGKVSFAKGGRLKRNVSEKELIQYLHSLDLF
ncbi:MAG: diadenylate cyclase CdaA [Bacteroidia bacterium]|nr:diadenylate cyclase CdaA [Bacteroidia bacterium]MDW8157528.1 diadenylate cyclase CdaA [Bacteroidia bacterium]